MIAIDTNILVRYITQDDLQQAEAAENLLAIYNNKPQSIFINNIVLCEFVWVLEKGYKYTQQQISSTIRIILSTEEFAFEYHNVLWLALEEYELKNTDFSDSLISKLNHNFGYKQTFFLINLPLKTISLLLVTNDLRLY